MYYKPRLKGKWSLKHCLAPFTISSDRLDCRLTFNGEDLDQKEERDWAIHHVGACSVSVIDVLAVFLQLRILYHNL